MKRAFANLISIALLGMAMDSEAASRPQTIAPFSQPPAAQAASPSSGEFKFFLAGVIIPDRLVGFFKESGDSMAFRCGDCSFVVGESGIASAGIDLGPGIVFKLSQDGSVLTATCKASACYATISEEAMSPGIRSMMSFSANLKVFRNSDSLNIPTKARVLFTVTK